MIDTVKLGRQMMMYAPNLDSDVDFNNWTRLAPRLIGIGTTSYPNSIKDLSPEDLQIVKNAMNILDKQTETV
jgi:hypothetical protein